MRSPLSDTPGWGTSERPRYTVAPDSSWMSGWGGGDAFRLRRGADLLEGALFARPPVTPFRARFARPPPEVRDAFFFEPPVPARLFFRAAMTSHCATRMPR